MKSYKEFRESTELDVNEDLGRPKTTIVIRKKGIGWEARYPAVDTTAGYGEDPIEAVKNLWNQPGAGDEDWEREGRKHDYMMDPMKSFRRNQGPAV